MGPLSQEVERLNGLLQTNVAEYNRLTNLYNELVKSSNKDQQDA